MHGRPAVPVEAFVSPAGKHRSCRNAKHEPDPGRATHNLARPSCSGVRQARRAWRFDGADGTGSTPPRALLSPTHTGSHTRLITFLTVMEASRPTWQMWHVRAKRNGRSARQTPRGTCRDPGRPVVDEVLDRRSIALTTPQTTSKNQRHAAGRRVIGLYRRRRRPVHIAADPRRGTAPGPRRGPPGRVRIDASAVELAMLEPGGERDRPRCRAGGAGPADVHLGCPAAARDRTGRRREDHRHAASPWPGPMTAARCSASPRRPPRPGPRRANRHPRRHPRETHLVPNHDDLPAWARVGPSTLVIIDEAGMADTPPSTPPSSSPSTEVRASG